MRLGRRHAPDHRDAAYSAAPLLPSSSTRRYRYWQTGKGRRLDQGQTDSCVGHGWSHFMATAPLTPTYEALEARVPLGWPHRTLGINPFAGSVYDRAQLLDEWGDTPPAGGTSVRAGAKALQEIKAITDYRWLSGTDQVTLALLELGPVVIGTDWLWSMENPSPTQPGSGSMLTVDLASGVAGGHCYLLTGVNRDTNRYRLLNSWGLGWGNQGYAYMTIPDFAKLLESGGEACLTSDLV